MTISLRHAFTSLKADGVDTTVVRPGGWNAEHVLTTDTTTGMVVGKDTSGAGALQELPILVGPDGYTAISSTKAFNPPKGTTAQRPVSPAFGDMRWNLDQNCLEVFGVGGVSSWTQIGAGSITPPGMVQAWPAAAASIPAGWIICNGQAVSRVANPGLFIAIGTGYGAGDGVTTFNVPNYTDKVLVGAGATYLTAGVARGAFINNVTLNATQLPAHTHTMGVALNDLGGGSIVGPGDVLQNNGPLAVTGGGDGLVGNPIAISTEQPGIGVWWAIKGG